MTLRPFQGPIWTGALDRRKSWIFATLFLFMAVPKAILLAVVPLEAHALLGDVRAVSVLYFAVSVAGLIGRLAIPWLTHVIARRWVFSLGAACTMISAAFLSMQSTLGLVTGLAINVFAYACLEITINLYVLDNISRHELSRFEPTRLFLTAGPWTIGPWLGVYLQANLAPWVPFAIAGAAAGLLVGYFWILRLRENTGIQSTRQMPPSPWRFLPRFFAQPRLRLAWILATGRAGWWGMFFVYAPIFAAISGLGEQAGGAIVSLGAGWIWTVPIWGWLGRRFGLRRLLMAGYVAAGLFSLAAALLIGVPWLGAVVLVFAALGTATIDGAGNLLFLRAVHPYERSEMTTVFVSYRDIAQLVPPGLFTLLLAVFQLPAVFVASGTMMLGLASLTRHIPRRF